MLTIHHLGKSQSERIVWLCEELGIDYDLKCYQRDPVTFLAPPDYKALHPIGSAPVITDAGADAGAEGGLVLAELGAIVEYIVAKYGDGRLALKYGDADFAYYLYWFHFANGTFQPNMLRNMVLRRMNLAEDNPMHVVAKARLGRGFDLVEQRLGAAAFFAGSAFTAADIMMVFSLTTMRAFLPFDLAPYANILAYLKRIGARPAYRRAMAKGDPGMAPLLA